MPQFLLPAFLIGFLGIIIPLIVHLWNTRDSRVIKVGSIRWIQESDSVKVSRIRWNEILLMLLRILIIIVLVLLLADLRSDLVKEKISAINWVLVDPAISDLTAVADSLTALEEKGWESHFLAKDFPLFTEEIEYSAGQNFWGLLTELNLAETRPDSILVFSYSNWANFHGSRPALNMVVNWVTIPTKPTNYKPVLALSLADSILVYIGTNEGSNLVVEQHSEPYQFLDLEGETYVEFSDPLNSKILVNELDSLWIQVNGEPKSDRYQNLLMALEAVNTMLMSPSSINQSQTPAVVFNLNDLSQKGTVLTFRYEQNGIGRYIIEPDRSTLNDYIITKELTIDGMLQYNFVKHLHELLSRKFDNDIRKNADLELPVNELLPQFLEPIGTSDTTILASLTTPLWLLLLALLTVERIYSYRRNQ